MNGQALDWTGIIGLLVIAGVFGGGFYGNNRIGVTEEYIANQFNARDIWSTNSNVLTSASATQKDILENRYSGAVRDAELQGLINSNQLSSNAMMQNCCCELKTAIHSEGEATRALIQNNTIQDLRDKIADKDRELLATGLSYGNTITANNLEERILGKLGRYYPYSYPYFYGTTLQ